MKNTFKSWLLTAAKLPKLGTDIFLSEVQCPSCGISNLEFRYIADKTDRIGFLIIWCAECKNGIRVSRVRVPNSFEFSTFDQLERGETTLPEFTEVQEV